MTTEETNALAVQIRVLAAVVNKMAMRDLEQRLEARQAGVSGLQYAVLGRLRRESVTLSDLSRRLSLAPATLVPVVDALELKGLVERGRDPLDRRRVPLYLTRGGRGHAGPAAPGGWRGLPGAQHHGHGDGPREPALRPSARTGEAHVGGPTGAKWS